MNIQTRLSAVVAVLLILSQVPMFAAQAFGDRTQTTTSPAKSPSSSQTAKPSPQLRPARPAKNSVMFTAVPPAPAQDARARTSRGLSQRRLVPAEPLGLLSGRASDRLSASTGEPISGSRFLHASNRRTHRRTSPGDVPDRRELARRTNLVRQSVEGDFWSYCTKQASGSTAIESSCKSFVL
jgi:hypothetical protein